MINMMIYLLNIEIFIDFSFFPINMAQVFQLDFTIVYLSIYEKLWFFQLA